MNRNRERGFSLMELVITTGVVLILSTFMMPSFLRYLRTAEVQASAREITAMLNRARSEAIRLNCTVSTTRTTGGFTFARGTDCNGGAGALVLSGMSAGGVYKPSSSVGLTGLTTATFTRLGNATASGTYTVTSTKYSTTMRVIIDPSGRITILQ